MKQGLLAFQYEQEKSSTGMTALSGLMTYLELMQAAGLRSSVERHVRPRERGQGWTDSEMIISLMLLNLAGGESVSDLDLLEKDGCLESSRPVVCVAESAGRWRRDGESSVVGGCRRSLRCSGIWRGSTTWTKSRSGKLTGRS